MISKSCFYNTKNKLKHRLQKLMYQKSKKNVMRRTIYINCSKIFPQQPQCGAALYVIMHEILQLEIPNLAH